jgi:hypothetical protein
MLALLDVDFVLSSITRKYFGSERGTFNPSSAMETITTTSRALAYKLVS